MNTTFTPARLALLFGAVLGSVVACELDDDSPLGTTGLNDPDSSTTDSEMDPPEFHVHAGVEPDEPIGPGSASDNKLGPHNCGDGTVQWPEECDDGQDNVGDNSYGSCNVNCKLGPHCGDGLVQSPTEECDQGPMGGDDCTPICTFEGFAVFVTSDAYTGGELDGLDGADWECKSSAGKAGLPEPEFYRAWLSRANEEAKGRLEHSAHPYYRLDRMVVATDWDDLTDGTLLKPIVITEHKDDIGSVEVWTNTALDGSPASEHDCDGWTDNSQKGLFGASDAIGGVWTQKQVYFCDEPKHLYCVKQSGNNG